MGMGPGNRLEIADLEATTMQCLAGFPLAGLPDPWDRLVVATAIQQGLPLVTRARAIRAASVVETIW